ncbi:MAG: cytochrome c biogenesis protein CcdA, partial [Pyrobaculum sp.]
MRVWALALLMSLILVAGVIQKGDLSFTDVATSEEFTKALRDGPVLIYFYQPNCPGCRYLETNVYTDPSVAQLLSGINLISIDIQKYLLTSLDVYINGSIYVYYEGSLREVKTSGRNTLPIPGTPVVVMGYVKNGVIYARLVMIGAVDSTQFAKFIELAYETSEPKTTETHVFPQLQIYQLAISFAAGVLSAFSPCVIPVLTIAATTYLGRRNMAAILAGMVASFSALATITTFVAGWAGGVTRTVLYGVGGAVLIAMGLMLVVERLNRSFAMWASRLQSTAFKTVRGRGGFFGDVALGLSLGAVWMPCIAPILGTVVVANIMLSALSGNALAMFVTTLTYALGLAVVIYLV